MQDLIEYFTANPMTLLIAISVCFALLYFIYRKLASSLVVIVIVFLLTLLGYSYYRDTSSIDEAITKTKIESQVFIERFASIFTKAGDKADTVTKEAKKATGK
ncbi:MAG: hypothetical protein WCJ49_03745 [Deltaproteobacteria bacterium]